jgi:hypothetical protein
MEVLDGTNFPDPYILFTKEMKKNFGSANFNPSECMPEA